MPDPETLLTGAGTGGAAVIVSHFWHRFITFQRDKAVDGSIKSIEVSMGQRIQELDDKIDNMSLTLAKEYLPKRDVIELHNALLGKLDVVITELGKINVTLVGKAD